MENKLSIRDSSISFLNSVILCQFGTLFFATIGLIIAAMFGVSNENFLTFLNTAVGCLLLSLFMDGLLVLIFLFFNKNKNNHIISKPSIKKLLIYISFAIICFLLLNPIVNLFNSFIYKFFPANDLTYKLTTTNYFISIISMVILPAIAEELVFRGIIFKGLQKYSNTFAITISAIMFSLFHLSLEQTIYPILMGLVLAVIMCYENNIIYCIAIHLTNNLIALTLKYFNISLTFDHWSYILIALVCLAIFITLITLAIKKLKNQKQPIAGEHKSYLIICTGLVFIFWLIMQFSIIFKG